MTILADQPELVALASLAAVPPSKLAAAFNDPEHFFSHVGLEEVSRLNDAVKRMGELSRQLIAAAEIFTEYTQAALEASQTAEVAPEDA